MGIDAPCAYHGLTLNSRMRIRSSGASFCFAFRGLNDQRVSPSSHPTNRRVTVHLPSFRMPSTSWSRYMVALPLAKEVALTVRGIHEMTSVRISEFKVFGAYLYSSPVYGA